MKLYAQTLLLILLFIPATLVAVILIIIEMAVGTKDNFIAWVKE